MNSVCTSCLSATNTCVTACTSVGFINGDDGKSCVNCDPNAQVCATKSTVTSCKTGYYVDVKTNLCS